MIYDNDDTPIRHSSIHDNRTICIEWRKCLSFDVIPNPKYFLHEIFAFFYSGTSNPQNKNFATDLRALKAML